MKKLFVSLGLAAAGTASLHAFDLLGTEDTRLWTVQATLRGFYDDNYLTAPKKTGSFGVELTPEFRLNMPLPQTEIGLRYNYGLYYYENRQSHSQNPIDQTHQLDLWIDHAFNPRWDLRFEDTVLVTQDPALPSTGTSSPRVVGNYLANTATVALHTDWTRKFSTALTYVNTVYMYENTGAAVNTNTIPATFVGTNSAGQAVYFGGSPGIVNASYAGLLNRIEQSIQFKPEWHFSRTTTGWVGYNFNIVNFTGNEPIAPATPVPYTNNFSAYKSSKRDNYSQEFYVGAQHLFLENLTGSAQAGVQYANYYNDSSAGNSVTPYGNLSLVYTYAPGSYAQLGFTESKNATDAVDVNTKGQITQDQLSSVLFGSINQSISPKLTGSVLGRFQYSTWHDGALDGRVSRFYNLGLNLSYAFNRHFSSDVGYNFDWYTTPKADQGYTRNRIYLGVTATY